MKLIQRQYNELGYAVSPQLLSPTECDSLVQEAHRIAEREQSSTRPLMQAHRSSNQFLSLLKDKRVVDLATSLLESPVSALQFHFYFAPPGQPGFMAHQDNFCIEGPLSSVISFWIPFVDVTPHNGGLYTYDKSHESALLPVVDIPPERIHPLYKNMDKETDVSGLGNAVNLDLNKGDALILHGENVHGSHSNKSDECRYSSVLTYIKRGVSFRPGFTAQRVEIEVQ
jgi:ectoine hydroxylase-related dioxygenase (phytanoyl-CoA dioxygenase family)